MNKPLVSALMIAAATTTAAAQADVPLGQFLEKRVPEELAVEGHVLSRENLTLRVEAVGDVLIVSLIALDTGRVVASTKVDQVPADREAAVASVTHVAADLETQLGGRPSVAPAVIDDRAERAAHEVADLRFHKQAIRFGETYELSSDKHGSTLHRLWDIRQGDFDQPIDPHAFYRLVGRPDLADEYDNRHTKMVRGSIVAGILLASTFGYGIYSAVSTSSCFNNAEPGQAGPCLDSPGKTLIPLAVLGTLTLVAGGYSMYYHYYPHPISEDDAKALANAYNQNLRRNLGLPVVEHHILRDIQITPVVTNSEGMLALGGRF